MIFGIVVTGFPFGGLGFAYLCTISEENPLLIKTDFLSSNAFIQVIVYFYLCFIILYFVMLPILSYAFKKQQENNIEPNGTCGQKFCCVLYYFFQIMFTLIALFMVIIKILGMPLLVYVLVEISRAGLQHNSLENL